MAEKEYERINFNIKVELLEKISEFTSNGYGRSALLNYLIASALNDENLQETLDYLKGHHRCNLPGMQEKN